MATKCEEAVTPKNQLVTHSDIHSINGSILPTGDKAQGQRGGGGGLSHPHYNY
jgi:hypothetical protein